MTAPESKHGLGFWAALGVGWSIIVIGVVGVAGLRDGFPGALRIAGWLIGGLLVHDLVVAPIVVVVGSVLAPRVGVRCWAPVRAGLIATAIVLAISIPLLGGFGRKPGNPSVLPLDYPTGVLTVLAVAWSLSVIWLLARARRARREPDPQRSDRSRS